MICESVGQVLFAATVNRIRGFVDPWANRKRRPPETRVTAQVTAANEVHTARAPFSVFIRESRNRVTKKPVARYVARFFDEDGNVIKTKTLEATSSTKATLEAKALLDKGEGVAKADPLILDFLAIRPHGEVDRKLRVGGRHQVVERFERNYSGSSLALFPYFLYARFHHSISQEAIDERIQEYCPCRS
jgi:hypothetical protein